MSRRGWVLWVVGGLVATVGGGVTVWIGLDAADKIGSVIGAACGLLGLGLSMHGLVRARHPEPVESAALPSKPVVPRSVTNSIAESAITGRLVQTGSVGGAATIGDGNVVGDNHWVAEAGAVIVASGGHVVLPQLVVPAGPRPELEEWPARVRDADPRHLGVHAAIEVSGASGLPKYVPRDLDDEVRAALDVGDAGRFVLLVGDSSVGKTRTLHEAVLASHPDRRLIHPVDGTAVELLAESSSADVVVWLDELQRYLGSGLRVASLRTLLGRRCVIVGTLWPGEYADRVVSPARGVHDVHEEGRTILDMATVIRIPTHFSTSEKRRAIDLVVDDPRLEIALDSRDGGVTQVLAAGPMLVHWWESAPPYAAALVTAAADARRMGVNAPLTRQFLCQAVPGYLTETERAAAPEDWLDESMRYATSRLHGALSALTPVGDRTMGGVSGYRIADYLAQHCLEARRSARLPSTAWNALVDHIKDPGDMLTVAMSAKNRLRLRYALPLFLRLAAAGSPFSAFAGGEAATILYAQGKHDLAITVLRPHAEEHLDLFAWLLVEDDRLDELTQRAAQDARSAEVLARHYEREGRRDEAVAALRPHADDWLATDLLSTLLFAQCKDQECMDVLTPWAEAGHTEAQGLLWGAALVAGVELPQYEPAPRAPMSPADPARVRSISEAAPRLLRHHNQLQALWDELEAGVPEAAGNLLKLLVQRGELTKSQVDVAHRYGLSAEGEVESTA